MAAILCKGIGDLCNACCNTMGNICILPFKACAFCCDGIVDMAALCNSPFSGFVIVTLIAQLPPVVMGLMEIGGVASCQGSQYALLGAVFGVINIAASIYLAARIINTNDERMSHLDTAFKRGSYLLCHDPWMAVYILVLLGFFGYLAVGLSWSWSGVFEEDESCSDTVAGNCLLIISFGWFYIFGGSMALSCSMCCACFDQRDYSAPQNGSSYNNAANMENGNAQGPPPAQPAQAYYDSPPQPTPYASSTGKPGTKKPAAGQPSQTPMYNSQGVPVDDLREPEIPMAYAEAVPGTSGRANTSSYQQQASAPPSSYDTSGTAAASASTTSNRTTEENAGATVGSAMGKNIGKIFKMDENKQKNLEDKGKQAGEAVGKGFLAAKNFVKGQMDKRNSTAANGQNTSGK